MDTGAYSLYVRMVFRYDGAKRAHGLSFFRSLFLLWYLYFTAAEQLQYGSDFLSRRLFLLYLIPKCEEFLPIIYRVFPVRN